MASRSENIDKILKKNYGKKIIIIDRFIDSTIAYQHYGMGMDLNLINKLNNFILDKFKPTFTFLNIVNEKNMKNRFKKRINLNKYDKFNYSFYDKVQQGFLKLAKKKNNYLIIDSNKNNIAENYQIIIKKIKKLIS
jgi:dTMP kinase